MVSAGSIGLPAALRNDADGRIHHSDRADRGSQWPAPITNAYWLTTGLSEV
jgi:hypothetical protein